MSNSQIRRPAEWEPHAATILVWPHNRDTWPDEMLARAESVFVELLKSICCDERVYLIVSNPETRIKAESTMDGLPYKDNIKLLQLPVNDMWVRDYGPICIKKGSKPHFLNFRFNAWGEKYPPWELDNSLAGRIAQKLNIPETKVPLTLEGGGIECNGNGTLMTTESVLINKNRKNGRKKDIEDYLHKYLGIAHIIWLAGGLKGDDTDGHIDNLARFIDHQSVVTLQQTRKSDPNYEILEENYRRLKKSRTAEGHPVRITDLPIPKVSMHRPAADGTETLPASYANFYITNAAVILPLYDNRFDQQMTRLFEDLFPGRRIIGIEAADLVWGQGSLHCITQEIYS